MSKQTYNHAFDVSFSVSNSQYEDYFECLKNDKEKVKQALAQRVRDVFQDNEYLEAIDCWDTYEEIVGVEEQWERER